MKQGSWRRAGLVGLGLVPFVLFVALLPGDSTLPPLHPGSSPVAQSSEGNLEFPFLDPQAPATTTTRPAPEPSVRPSPAAAGAASPSPPPSASPAPTPLLSTTVPRSNPFGPPAPACSNGVDDDGDGAADMNDPGCASSGDHTELDNPACSNGLDDDGDGAVDGSDPGCANPRDRFESDDNRPPDRTDPDAGDFEELPEEVDDGAGGFPLEGLPP